MSWQRILELARQRGLPVIVTDIGGREPMAILPLEEYERLAEGQKNTAKIKQENRVSKEELWQGVVDEIKTESVMEDQKVLPIDQKQDVDELFTADSLPDEGLTREERFYLEPVDETLD
ncbi:MAG: hypothetical protein Q7N87_04615 [Candidatus Uhrbacteria bacterium]|nr:hypothetical protein [Candidatus Uhrbacteria bacterium]